MQISQNVLDLQFFIHGIFIIILKSQVSLNRILRNVGLLLPPHFAQKT